MSSTKQEINYNLIVGKFPWLIQPNQKAIISPDSDGFLCALLYSNLLNWDIVGYYDGKVMILKNGTTTRECIFLDMEVFRRDIRSIGHHMVMYNKNELPLNWSNYSNALQLNNMRLFDLKHDFQRKYPFGTIHFLLSIFHSQQLLNQLIDDAIWPLLFSDGVWNNLFGYTENCLEWIDYLKINEQSHILYPIFCGDNSIFSIMNGINHFLRIRDTYNATGFYYEGDFIERRSSRTGDKLRISNTSGEPINLVEQSNLCSVHETEKVRVQGFIQQMAEHMNLRFITQKWAWNDFKLCAFTKHDFNNQQWALNSAKYANILSQNPLSWAITSGTNMEFTLETPDRCP